MQRLMRRVTPVLVVALVAAFTSSTPFSATAAIPSSGTHLECVTDQHSGHAGVGARGDEPREPDLNEPVSPLPDQAKGKVKEVRTKIADAKRKTDEWLLWTAIAVTVIGVLGALGQMSLIRSCWRGLTWKPAEERK